MGESEAQMMVASILLLLFINIEIKLSNRCATSVVLQHRQGCAVVPVLRSLLLFFTGTPHVNYYYITYSAMFGQ